MGAKVVLHVLQKLVGHASIVTSQRDVDYANLDEMHTLVPSPGVV